MRTGMHGQKSLPPSEAGESLSITEYPTMNMQAICLTAGVQIWLPDQTEMLSSEWLATRYTELDTFLPSLGVLQ